MIKTVRNIVLFSAWFPLLIFASNAVVWHFHVYEYWPPVDIPMHFLGGVAITYFFWKLFNSSIKSKLLRPIQSGILFLLVFSLTCTTTVFWEFAEYILDHTIASNVQLGLEDTLLDMLLGIVGGCAFLLVVFLSRDAQYIEDKWSNNDQEPTQKAALPN